MAVDDLVEILGHMPLGFHKFEEGEVVVRAFSPCTQLLFITDGTVSVTTEPASRHYSIEENFEAPYLPEPERVFGLHQHFTRTVTASSSCNCISISKENAMQLLSRFSIFRINLLNILSTQSQRLQQRIYMPQGQTLSQRLANFLAGRCIRASGTKVFHTKMRLLSMELSADRRVISAVLHNWADAGLITMSRGCIKVEAMERLIQEAEPELLPTQ